MDVRILLLFTLFLLVPGASTFTNYFLKFETSGAACTESCSSYR